MDLVSSIRKTGSRGGVNFNWDDVATSNHRENYLGHSLKAPVGRWAKGRDLTWYAKADGSGASGTETEQEKAERERKEELKRIKEAEEDALARALGLPIAPRKATGANAVDKERVQSMIVARHQRDRIALKDTTGGDIEAGVAAAAGIDTGLGHRGEETIILSTKGMIETTEKIGTIVGGCEVIALSAMTTDMEDLIDEIAAAAAVLIDPNEKEMERNLTDLGQGTDDHDGAEVPGDIKRDLQKMVVNWIGNRCREPTTLYIESGLPTTNCGVLIVLEGNARSME
ncbi:kinase phosphorylation protein-domain-containing protein [Hypoxylon trugodes]|uniref:kinase phosphorylation protein-domain-containing protein n=1 Tax=Hypoxylon trugodes TaxID=326681 RepID=UPI0021908C44|nr:kinase phosphorylation protein-domain-containing protein [Hypoxylon trugodes]KAI1390922.1 kinase phosphorylation protein-domain-containing protein [Hypoxylon trugodes]